MNFIDNLMQSKQIFELDDLNNEIPKLQEQLDDCSKELSKYLDDVQEEIENQSEQSKSHMNATNKIRNELSSLETTLHSILQDDLKSAEKTYDTLVDEVNEITSSISFVHLVCEMHERLELLKEFCSSKDYVNIVEVINVLDVLVRTLPTSPKIPFIECLKGIVNKEISTSNQLLRSEFHKHCSFVKNKNIYVMKITGNNLEILHSIFSAVYKNKSTQELLVTIPNLIWENLIIPLIKYSCEINEVTSEEFVNIQVKVLNDKHRVQYREVYNKISAMMGYLIKYLDCEIDVDLKLMNFIGVSLKEKLSESIMKECIFEEIPGDWRILPQFKESLTESTTQLEEKLRPYSFIDKHWEWIDKIEEFYTQKKCKYFSTKAKEFMKKDLHNMIEIGTPYNNSKPFLSNDEILHCAISSYIPELIKLGNEIINEISEGPEENSEALFATYKGIFFNYGDFVATHHQKLLETIPQQVALFYNNCMYLYKQLQKWDEIFETEESFEKFRGDSSKAYYQVEEVGRMFFDSFVREQKEQIQIILKGTNLQNRKTLEKLEENTEKLFRQCLRQQELLKTVWSKVLSYPVYNQTIGDILNTMCNFLINSIVVLEDIGAVVAENLIELFKIILSRGVKLFTDSNEVFLYVSQWHKFNELIFVLGASLLDISDRWADGKGPLALQFTPYELKQLIRALFQNSDRRSAVLSRIHE